MNRKKLGRNIISFIIVLVLGLLVFVVFSHMRPVFDDPFDWIGRLILGIILLGSGMILRKMEKWKNEGEIVLGFFIALVAISIDLYLPSSKWIRTLFGVTIDSPVGIALDKLDSSVLIILTVLLLSKLFGGSLGSIFMQKGKWKKSLLIGTIAFGITMIGSYFMAQLFGAVNLSLARILPWIPWIAIFIFGNAFNEELLFRGLFLNKIKPVTGSVWANLVLILPFVLHHTGVTYTNNTLMFLGYLIPLAFFWARIMQKTDTLIGSVLFHAGTDISVVLVLFSQL